MQGRGEGKEERIVWAGAKDGGDTWESWKSPHGQTSLSGYTYTQGPAVQVSITKGAYRPTKTPGTAST